MEGFSPTKEATNIGFVQMHQVGNGDHRQTRGCLNITGVSKSGRVNNSRLNEALKAEMRHSALM